MAAPIGRPAEALTTALLNTLKALELPFSDPVLETWASWPERAPWIMAEIEQAIGLLSAESSATSLTSELQRFRHRFRADADGWPPQDVLTMTGDREDARDTIAFQRLELYEQAQTGGLGTLLIRHPECLFHAFSDLDPYNVQELGNHLRIGIYPHGGGKPENFLEQHSKISQMWEKRSAEYSQFTSDEIIEVLSRPNAFLSTIYHEERLLQYGITLCGMDSFLPQTITKLRQFNQMQLPTRHDVYAWEYFSCGNPDLFFTLRHWQVDWYKLYQEVLFDLVISQGKETLLGIVDIRNPAAKSHSRVGYEPIPSRLLFPTDHGGSGQIIKLSPYVLNSELWRSSHEY
jgi:hypothetical protein